LNGITALLSNGIWLAAILMPAGFFLSAAGRAACTSETGEHGKAASTIHIEPLQQ
jgi:hypothetical protein